MKAILFAKALLIATVLFFALKLILRFVWRAGPFVASLVFFIAVIFIISFALLDTRRDVAYRYAAPGSDECVAGRLAADPTILASENIDNDELAAVHQIVRDDP